MIKKFLIYFIMILLIIGLSGKVLAKNKYTTTSNINGVIVKWEYELNESNQIENLKCTNVSAVTGNITIPNALNGKTVVSIGSDAFRYASNITSVVIPNSIKEIGDCAFLNCTKLNKVDLGNIETLSHGVFFGCTSLTEITIPKTLKKGSISQYSKKTNISKITLEDGLTKVPASLCANTEITEIIIPDSVKEIEYYAFENCTKLSKVDLGNIETLSFGLFNGCTSLTEIKIPKTLKNCCMNPGFGNSITKIILEDGLTVVPSSLCSNAGITEITIPNSVEEIRYSAFDNCANLKKITILDNVKDIGLYDINAIDAPESVFKDHNSDLTIYCYENSMAAKYAIKYNIKHVYLQRPTIHNNDKQNEKINQQQINNEILTSSKKIYTIDDKTTAKGALTQTGLVTIGIFVFLLIAGIIIYIKSRRSRKI